VQKGPEKQIILGERKRKKEKQKGCCYVYTIPAKCGSLKLFAASVNFLVSFKFKDGFVAMGNYLLFKNV